MNILALQMGKGTEILCLVQVIQVVSGAILGFRSLDSYLLATGMRGNSL